MTDPRPSSRRETRSPVELGGDPGRPALGWATATIATAALLLALFNAEALDGWAAEQPPGAAMARVSQATEAWLGVTQRLGLAAPRAAAHRVWKAGQRARFAGQKAADAPDE